MYHFRCFVDCGAIVSSSNKFRVTSEILISGATYTWRLEIFRSDNQVWEIVANLDDITSTPINTSNIIIKPNKLSSYSKYRLQLNVKAPMLETVGLALLEFETAGKPYGGHCKSSVTEGVELETEITFECLDWQDKTGTALTYEIRRENTLIYYSASTKSDPIALSAGLPEENYQVQIEIVVKNAVGECVVQMLMLKVGASCYLCCMFHLRNLFPLQ